MRENRRAQTGQVGLANRRLQPLGHLSDVCFQQLTTELEMRWCATADQSLEKCERPQSAGLSATSVAHRLEWSLNFSGNCWGPTFTCLSSSIRVQIICVIILRDLLFRARSKAGSQPRQTPPRHFSEYATNQELVPSPRHPASNFSIRACDAARKMAWRSNHD